MPTVFNPPDNNPGLPDPGIPLAGDWSAALHAPFVRQASQVGEKMAVVGAEVSISYTELDRLSNQLAHYLCAHDCAGRVVAIYAERSPTLVWAILGILKAGAAFLVLDSAYPAARLAEYCRQAAPHALLQLAAAGALPDDVSDLPAHRLVLPDSVAGASQLLADYPDSAPETQVGPDQLAYIMFTSGSTGKPKGIAGTHAPPAHFMAWHIETFRFTASARFSLFSGLAHDILLRDIFTPLSVGATLYVPQPDDFSPGRLSAWIQQHQITVTHLTPPLGQLMTADATVFASLRYLFFGGDKLPTSLVNTLHQLAPDATCVNFYGATETPQAMGYFIIPGTGLRQAIVPVGRGIQDVQLLVLTDELTLAGIAEVGEIAIRTPYLASGYLGADTSDQAFITNPFTNQPGDRLYRTGDLGRYLPDGNVEILGRRDHQVQIRGYRIELSEIEAALNAHPAVQEGIVVVREAARGTWLVAYAVASHAIGKTWRAYLSARLPDYMVPNALVQLERFPLTPNGKIDLSALPEPSRSEEEFVAPRTPTEARLAAIWCEVLGVDAVGVADNFLALGGHSLLATQVISRVRDAFGVELSLRWLFDEPTVTGLSEQIQNAQNALPPIPLAVRDWEPGLSFAQQRLWFLEHMQPEETEHSGLYNIYRTIRLTGPLDVTALAQGFSVLVRRHESLRTSFGSGDGQPIQVIHPPFAVDLPVVNLTSKEQDEQTIAIQRLATETVQQSFDLAQAPLWRVRLVRLGTEEHLFLFTIHHIISDAWSMRVLCSELSALYSAHLQGESVAWPPLEIQYPDYTCWQQQRAADQATCDQLAYWKTQLSGTWPVLELPRDYPLTTRRTFNTQRCSLTLPHPLQAALQTLSRDTGATSFMTLLATFKTLLYRYTGQADIIVGTPVAGRNRAQLEGLIGCFLNTLALRTDLSGNPSFREVLGRVRQVALSAYAHQDLPFEKLVEELPAMRHMNHAPRLQVWFNMLPHNQPLDLQGLHAEPLDLVSTPGLFDLSVYASENDDLTLKVLYNTDLFSAARIQLLLTHWHALLEDIVAAPDAPVSTYRLPQVQGQNQIKPTHPFTPFPVAAIAQSIPTRFAAQVSAHGHQTAIKTRCYTWTYRQLDERANQIAQALLDQASGVGRIALLFEHDAPMIAGMLGVLQAGKTYVPLDPLYPEERLCYILADSQAQAIVTNNQNIAYARKLTQGTRRLINLDQLDANPGKQIQLDIPPDTLAYILYTSGSTGQPKGVMQTHRNVLHFIRTYTNNLHISATDQLTLLASYSFDAAVMNLFGALLNGATLHPFDLKQNTFGELVTCLNEQKITIYHSTPTVYRHLINTLTENERLQCVRLVVLGGEAVSQPDVEAYKQHFSDECLFINGLGPTESTVTLQYFIDKQTELTRHAVPVGYPVDNTQVLLLNEAGEETDIYGEIAIRSEHVALGYWRKEEKSAAVFLPDPAGGRKRLYRMGDLGRYLPDGSLEFVGRKDTQVKIRGYRIELGEVENVLSQHSAVEASVVIVWGEADNQQLVAYVVCAEPQADIEQLRDFIRQKLPAYMVPQTYVQLEALPQTPTGKTDRRALPAPDLSDQQGQQAFVAPRTPTEELLATIFGQVLQRTTVGIHDNFFALGGHSLRALQIIARIRQTFAVDVPLRCLFDSPTIAELAHAIQTGNQASLTPIVPVPRDGALPLSTTQLRLWLLEQMEGTNVTYRLSRTLRLVGKLDQAALRTSLTELVRRHEGLRTTFTFQDGQPKQVIHDPEPVRLPVEELSNLPDAEQQAAVLKWVQTNNQVPFDLTTGPLLRLALLRLAANEHLLLITMHHIISDARSMQILFEELSLLYDAAIQGNPAALPELPIQYADFAHWQQQTLQGEHAAQQLAYWKKHLAGDLPVLELPRDKARPARQTFSGGSLSLTLDEPLCQALAKLSRESGVTLFMTLLAAFKTLLYRYTQEKDIIIGTPHAYRHRAELEGLIGFFINTLVLRTDLSANPTFCELLDRVRQVALAAYAHQDVPFEKLVETLQPSRDLSRTPIFQVWFNMTHTDDQPRQLAGLSVENLSLVAEPAKFDVSLYVFHKPNGILDLNLVYNVDLFSKPRMTHLLGQYQYLLEQIAASARQTIDAYSLITPDAQLPDPGAPLPEPAYALTTDLIARWARQQPQQPAIEWGEQTVSYHELYVRAETIAQRLLSQGIQPGDVVAISSTRSIELVASLIGVLLSGGVFLTLEPSLPPQRRMIMLTAAQARYLLDLTGDGTAWLTHEIACQIITTDPAAGASRTSEPDHPLPTLSPQDAAYIFFTSGTTGTPKGVTGSHKGISHFVHWQRKTFAIGSSDRIAQLTSLAFDALLRDVFLPLTSGAVLCIPTEPEESDLPAWLEQKQITVLHLVPSRAKTWLAADTMPLPAMRWLFFSGEPLTEQLINRWRKTFGADGKIVNLYGATETTMIKCYYPVPTTPHPGVQPVGRPLPDTQALIFRDQQRCGIGEPGEVVIRTPFRTRGYLNAPNKCFVQNPCTHDAQDLLYYTGDQGRYRPDGTLEILDRLDHQIKIRGVRLEPQEIEAILNSYPAARESVVIAYEREGDKQLAAYIVADTSIEKHAMRSFLTPRLPHYMIPNLFIQIEDLPLTSSGKINRRALPAPADTQITETAPVMPQTKAQQQIAAIWQEVLKREQVGIHDNFFDLGGHSLLMAQIYNKLREIWPEKLSMVTLFQYPTIQPLAEYLSQQQDAPAPTKDQAESHRERRSSRKQRRQIRQKTK